MSQFTDFFKRLFEHADFRSLWKNGSWTTFHGWLYIVSDLLIWSAYFVIPLLILFYLITKRSSTRFSSLYLLFATFILMSGATYFVDAFMFWVPVFRFSALMRFITGVISWITVFYVVKVLPIAFSLRSAEELEAEINNRRSVETALQDSNELLQKAEKIARLCYFQWDVLNDKLRLSESAKYVLELSPDLKITHSNFTQIVHPDDLKHLEKTMDTIFIKKIFPDFYCRVINAKKEIRHLFARGEVILNEDSCITIINGTLQDVTEEREYLQKIELQNQKLKDIAWIQSHKVRSPVATILGLMQLYNKEDLSDPTNLQILEGLEEASINLDSVIKEINAKTEMVVPPNIVK
jgi:PAS domain-containing protein